MGRSASTFKRGEPRYVAEASTLIICEDLKSSRIYLTDATKHFNIDAVVEVDHCGKTDPLGIVNNAIGRKGTFQKIFCVFDGDAKTRIKENFDSALKAAKKHGIELIISYPCFEFWLLLHFHFSRKAYQPGEYSAGEQMVQALKLIPEMDNYDKGATADLFKTLFPRLPIARNHSIRALRDAIDVSEFNPSSRIHELFDEFEVLSRPQ